MYIFKSKKIGTKVDMHTDNTYIISKPLSCIGIWVALEDATPQNGCMWGIPGSHKTPTSYFMYSNGKNTYYEGQLPNYKQDGAVCLPVSKGSIILLHGDLVHFSGDNTSDVSRHAYTMHIVEQKNCEWD